MIEFTASPSSTQAGSHPDLEVNFKLGTRIDPLIPNSCNCNQAKNALVELPAGLIGSPSIIPKCTTAQFSFDQCPIDSQVGVARPSILINDGGPGTTTNLPLYNLVPAPGQAALLGFKAEIYNFPIYTAISARTGSDYGLNAEVKGITDFFGLRAFTKYCGVCRRRPRTTTTATPWKAAPFPPAADAASNVRKRRSSRCRPLASDLDEPAITTAYDHGRHEGTAPWPATTGCDQLGFNPALSAKPSTDSGRQRLWSRRRPQSAPEREPGRPRPTPRSRRPP